VGAALDSVLCQAHVRLLEAGARGDSWGSTVSEGDLADVLRGGPADLEHPGLGRGDGRTVGGQGGGELTGARGAHPHRAAGDGVDDLLDRAGGDDATAADHQELAHAEGEPSDALGRDPGQAGHLHDLADPGGLDVVGGGHGAQV
jgi:hypothetical protein